MSPRLRRQWTLHGPAEDLLVVDPHDAPELPIGLEELHPRMAIWRVEEWFRGGGLDGGLARDTIQELCNFSGDDETLLELVCDRLRAGKLVALRTVPEPALGDWDGQPEAEAPPAPAPPKKRAILQPPPESTAWVAIELVDASGKPMANEPYRLILPDGSVTEGRLDGSGKARVDEIVAGTCQLTFPRMDEGLWQSG